MPTHSTDFPTAADQENQPASTLTQPVNVDDVFFPTAPSGRHPGNFGRPSDIWLRNPGWIDGARDPALYYASHEEMDDALRYWGLKDNKVYDQMHASITPTPQPAQVPLNAMAHLISAQVAQLPAYGALNKTAIDEPPAGFLVSVTMIFSAPAAPNARGRSGVKKEKSVKMERIKIDGITRTDFIKEFLRIHSLSDHYSPGVHSGPQFRIWWTGITKSSAAMIQTDQEFLVVRETLATKERTKCQVSVEFDVETMEGFRIAHPIVTPAAAASQADDELLYGTRVPSVAGFSADAQLNGRYILMLQEKWPCATHRGEHGEVGFCYISPTSEHIRLNNRRLKAWADAMAAGEATKNEPPNVPLFDGPRDGLLSMGRPRGRKGNVNDAIAPNSGDQNALLMAVLISSLKGKRSRSRSRSRSHSPSPKKRQPLSPVTNQQVTSATPLSPMPEPGSELHACLKDFAVTKGIDLMACEEALAVRDLTPDIIPKVPVARLCDVTEVSEGRIIKLQLYCKEWQDRLETKVAHVAKKRRL
ncbi:hypothetical protein H0H93_010421 [Arthromyces matolae]|nr:hypothetical protein H0H93_010421 [Arthromyces matolae]